MSDACCSSEVKPGAEVKRLYQVRELQLAAGAGVLLLIGWLVGSQGWHIPSLAIELISAVAAGATFAPDALRNLRNRRINVDTLMTIAAIGAVSMGQVAEAAMLGILFSIAEGLEHYAVSKTRSGLRALLSLVPPVTKVIRAGSEISLAPMELEIGDLMVLRPGERAATDGLIVNGRTRLDLAAITGESVPVKAGPGSTVYAGSINGGGAIEVAVTALASDSSLARIVHLVEEAQERKGSGQRLADRVARPLVPLILGLSVLIAATGSIFGDPLEWIERALVVLVAASPCALAISVPLTVVAAVGAATRQGALVKGGAAVEELGRIKVIAIDKTGTLTRNAPQVFGTVTVPGISESEALGIAAAVEARSEHPLAQAIVIAAGTHIRKAADVTATPGHGISGFLDGRQVRLGKPGWIAPGRLAEHVAKWQAQGVTVVLLEVSGTVQACIGVRDELRPEAAEAIRLLTELGIQTVMLTGDNSLTAAALARDAGISEFHAGLLPEDKARLLSDISGGRPIAMVGDGINDAPALATADVGIALGAMGTDVAIETADVALMGEDLRHLPQLLAHARHARRIMLQNIWFSLAIIGTLIPLAAFGTLGLATVVFIHESAEVLVILNAIRAGRRRTLPGLATAAAASSTHHIDIGAPPAVTDTCCAPKPPIASVAVPPVPISSTPDDGCGCCSNCPQ